MDPIMFNGLLMIVAIFVTPTLLFVLFFMWLELRDVQRSADYYCEQWESVGRRLAEAHNAEDLAFSDGYSAGRADREWQMLREVTQHG